MSQHDMDVANAPRVAVRADINQALQALVTNNSGATEPAITFAYQWWADTTAGILKQRNAANSAWISILTLATGMPLGAASTAYVDAAVAAAGAASVPAGVVIFHAANAAPSGYLKANGALVSRTTYAALFTAIGTTFGAGDGSTTFGLPDLRAEFVRGWDDGRGVDSGRVFGSQQTQDIQSHSHTVTGLGTVGGEGSVPQYTSSPFTNTASVSPATSSTGGTETRPRNRALLACIKF